MASAFREPAGWFGECVISVGSARMRGPAAGEAGFERLICGGWEWEEGQIQLQP